MRKIFLLTIILINFSTLTSVKAQDKGFGLGVIIGEPTGLSAKYWLDENKALNFGLAYSFVQSVNALSVHCDYIYHNYDVIKSDLRIPVYYGFGARFRVGNDSKNALGARGVLGILYLDEQYPFDVFAEIAPVFNLFPKTSLQVDLAIGARYYFR
ncbi:MAG: hypothetical protein FD122_3332 [Stygiobacter sp.]|nr:MAG: hypothetical protein FD122_3332 [Stygiobacter sp.]KAF0214787.1 MAG: hypothetical protein FD178_2160 [Ignavibacteria bacterium]